MNQHRVLPTGEAWDAATLERNWLVYRLQPRNDGSGKSDKIPTIGGRNVGAGVAACLTFDEATTDADRRGPPFGVGHLPRPGSILIGLDFDSCVAPWVDDPDPWVRDIIGPRCATWLERSPSGAGLRAIVVRDQAPTWMSEKGGIGYYGTDARFFTTTFDPLPGWANQTLWQSTSLVERVLARLGHGAAEPPRAEPTQSNGACRWFDDLSEERQLGEVERMLGHLAADEYGSSYELWWSITCAVYRATDSTGYETWDAWCQRLPAYNAGRNAYKWGTVSGHPNPATVGTLIMHARQHGYQAPPLRQIPRLHHNVVGVTTRLRRLGRSSRR